MTTDAKSMEFYWRPDSKTCIKLFTDRLWQLGLFQACQYILNFIKYLRNENKNKKDQLCKMNHKNQLVGYFSSFPVRWSILMVKVWKFIYPFDKSLFTGRDDLPKLAHFGVPSVPLSRRVYVRSLCHEYQFPLKLALITTTKISLLDSLWRRHWEELGNGLFLIKNDFLKNKEANNNDESRCFGVIMTLFSRQSE